MADPGEQHVLHQGTDRNSNPLRLRFLTVLGLLHYHDTRSREFVNEE